MRCAAAGSDSAYLLKAKSQERKASSQKHRSNSDFMPRPKPLVLIILDGWGYLAETNANAIALARKPVYDRLLREYPNTLIQTSGPYVGLPDGQMGNSDGGRLNIGAGPIVHMDSAGIERMIQNGEFFRQPLRRNAMKNARTGGRQLH